MRQVQDVDSGEIVDVEDAQLPELAASGKFALPAGEYEFTSPYGERIKVDAAGFRQAVEGGYKYVDEKTREDERLDEKYGDSSLRALAEGTARTLTLGASDQLLANFSEDGAEGLSERKERNPLSAGAGEAIGIVAPIIATGGGAGVARGIGAKILGKTASGQVAQIASKAGAGASQLIKNEFAKGATKLGVEGAIEGALQGVGKTISEDALGDTEFGAEALMANVGTGALTGAGFGAALGATGAVVSKLGRGAVNKLKLKAIDDLNIPENEKAVMRDQLFTEKELLDVNSRLENPELKQAIQELGFKSQPTTGVLSPSLQTKRLEASLAESPSLPGVVVGNKLKKFVDETQAKAAELFEAAKDTTPYELGTKARQNIMAGVNERLRPAQETLGRIYRDLGEAPIKDRAVKLLRTRIAKSDAAAFNLDKGLAARLDDAIPELTTINRVNTFKKAIGKEMRFAYRSGDTNQAELLSDVYDTLSRMERIGIKDAARAAGPKRGPKLAKEYLKAFDDSMKAYRSIYREYTPLAEQLGTKLKRPDDFLDWLESTESEKIGRRLIDLNDFDSAVKLNKDFPELFDVARGQKLAEFLGKVKGKDDAISPAKFQKAVVDLTPEQKKILFGFSNAEQKRLTQIVTVMRELPEKINPSGTSINQTFLDILNPIFQGKEMLRYALYKGGDKAFRNYLLKAVPVLTQAEKEINRTKGAISSSVSGFYRSLTPALTGAALTLTDDRKINDAKKVYEQVYNDPQGFVDRFTVKNPDLTTAAPNVAAALQQKMMAGLRFLQSKVPQSKTDYSAHDYTPSRSELLGFQEYVEAVEQPMKVLQKLKMGYISPRHMEALKVVYPKLYNSVQDDLAAKMPKKLSTSQKIMLQQVLGAKVAPIANYQAIQAVMQPKTAAMPAQQQRDKVSLGAAKNLNASTRTSAGTLDRTLYRS